jgi:hypothetical protein
MSLSRELSVIGRSITMALVGADTLGGAVHLGGSTVWAGAIVAQQR